MSISFPLARDSVAVLLVSHLGSDVFIMQNHLKLASSYGESLCK